MRNKSKNILINFGIHLRKIRIERGFSQEVLAAKAGLHRTYIGMLERGEKNITLNSMLKISRALKIEISMLVEGIDTNG